jgi:hypothetical protein
MDQLKTQHKIHTNQQKERIISLEKELSIVRSKWALAEQLRCQSDSVDGGSSPLPTPSSSSYQAFKTFTNNFY